MIWEQAPQLFLILFISQEGQGSLQAIPDFAAPPDRAASGLSTREMSRPHS